MTPGGGWLSSSPMVDWVLAMAESDCERLRSGWLAQPANGVSSLTYVAVGLGLLWGCWQPGARRNVLAAGGAGMIVVGVGSFAFHGPQPDWAHPVHNGSVVALVAAMAGCTLHLLGRAATRPVVVAAWRRAAPWFLPAAVLYLTGRSGAPLCHPGNLWQPHAAWHILTGLALGVVIRGYVRDENRRAEAPVAGGRPAPRDAPQMEAPEGPGLS